MKTKLLALAGLLPLLALTPQALAQPHPRMEVEDPEAGDPDDSEGLVRAAGKLGLSEDQRTKVREAVQKAQLARVDLKARAERGRLELRHALSQPTPDAKAVARAVDALNAAEADMRRNRVDLILTIRGILTEDQWKRAMEMRASGRMHERAERREEREERREEREDRRDRRDERKP